MNGKNLGKISRVRFGFGGYQDAQFGLSLTFEGDGWGVSDFIGAGWATWIEVSPNSEWSEVDRDAGYAKMCRRIDSILQKAKVKDVSQLKDMPVEVSFNGNTISDWRVLEEVL
jgi:hypothetical protein